MTLIKAYDHLTELAGVLIDDGIDFEFKTSATESPHILIHYFTGIKTFLNVVCIKGDGYFNEILVEL